MTMVSSQAGATIRHLLHLPFCWISLHCNASLVLQGSAFSKMQPQSAQVTTVTCLLLHANLEVVESPPRHISHPRLNHDSPNHKNHKPVELESNSYL